jgi:protease-4
MKNLVIVFALVAAPAAASDIARRDLLPAPPGVTAGSLGGFANPAAWATSSARDLSVWWNDDEDWGFSHAGVLGVSVEQRLDAHHYRVGVAGGDRRGHVGAAWRWSAGSGAGEGGIELGTIARPSKRLSFGAAGFASVESDARAVVADVGVRPFESSHVTLFADWTLERDERPDEGTWSAGVELRPVSGLHAGARILDQTDSDGVDWRLNVGLTLDRVALHALPGFDEDGERRTTTWIVRANPPHRGLPLPSKRRWVAIDLEDKALSYQKDLWFDDDRAAWLDVGRRLREARRDPAVEGVVLNLAGASLRPSLVWELRTELAALREAGKQVRIHVDRVRMSGAYLASVADRVSMDPNGQMELGGIALHRTYWKGLLDKLGLGFEELRFFPYKTAAETYSRTEMSAADREQYGREVDVLYETIRGGVCEGRGVTAEAFDGIVDGPGLLRAPEAKDAGLIDELARWPDVVDSLEKQGAVVRAKTARAADFPDERWGRPPTVALVYAEGICATDEGIRGRATSAHLRKLAGRTDVAAVVLRADSPGGDRLASDLVADALRRIREKKKPVVVSQGDVAASGGYWISMESDRIFTTPLTVTGSIGVISGWVWDAGVGERTGFSASGVQRGAHADLRTGIRFPFVDARLPGRPLSEAERDRAQELIERMYGEFVARVAAARGLDEGRVREIGGGRIWMGGDAVERNLCDDFGTLLDAVEEAAGRAGLDPVDVTLDEYPPRRRFRIPRLLPGLPAFGAGTGGGEAGGDESYDWRYLHEIAGRPGEALLLTPPEAVAGEQLEF